jgi:hypothetical protein
MDPQQIKTFQCIVKFVEDLSAEFEKKQHSLVLYNRLIVKTGNNHHDSIKRHIKAFHDFVTQNKEAILTQNASKMKNSTILYSKKVNIKMDEIFKMADDDTSQVIWRHLLVIMNRVDPSKEAVDLLKKSMEEKSSEGEFLSDLVGKIEKSVDPNTTDPMSAIMGMMSSGVFTELISSMNSGMKDGSLDIGKLFNSVQGMMGSIGDMIPPKEQDDKTQSIEHQQEEKEEEKNKIDKILD